MDSDPLLLPPPDEPMLVARQLLGEHYRGPDGAQILRHWRGEFWQWQTSHWLPAPDGGLRSRCYLYAQDALYERTDKNGSVTLHPWAPTQHKIGDLVDAIRATTHLSATTEMPGWLSGDGPFPAADLVACANGLLHVPSRTLIDHDPAYFNRVAVPFAYQANPEPPSRWLAFLDQLWPDDPEAIRLLAEFMGYVISGRRDLHKILLLIGPTRAGKGVIARVLKALVGLGNHAGPTLASLGTNFGLAPLIGKPLAIVSDARLGGSANVHQIVERLLSISGEDMLTIDVKFREAWTGTLPTRFLVISNELPRFGDASGAIAGRFLVLTLQTSWLGREDPALTDALLTELPGILGWVLDGLDRLLARGRFAEPASSRDAVVALADLVSPASAFIRERCVTGRGFVVPCDKLYQEWKAWADDNGHRPGSTQTFGRDLRAVVPAIQTRRPRAGDERYRTFEGIGLRTDQIDLDRGPARTSVAADSRPDPAPVRDGPRPMPLSLGDPAGDGTTDQIDCDDYLSHQSAHRRVAGGWICGACSGLPGQPQPEWPRADEPKVRSVRPAGDDWGTIG